MKRVLSVIVVCTVAGVLWLLVGRGAERGSTHAAPIPPSLPERVAKAGPVLEPVSSGRTESPFAARPAVAAEPARAAEDLTADTPVHVRGRVLDRAGVGQPGVQVVMAGGFLGGRPGSGAGTEVAVSGVGGAFEAELQLGPNGVTLESGRDSDFATLRAAHVRRESGTSEQLIVVAPAIELAGTVVEAGGGPLAGARLRLEVPLAALVGFPEVLDGTVEASADAVTGPDGRFVFLRVPATAGALLSAQRSGYRSLERAAPTAAVSDLRLELEPKEEGDPWLMGVVLKADGTPAKGAKVQLDSQSTKTDANGRFGLEQEWANPEAPLVAALPGFQPALLPNSGDLMQQESPPPLVRLVLGGPTLTIQGKILDAEGAPCRGWQVSLLDGTVITPSCVPFDLAEDLARGKKVATKSDKAGAFELGGLLARDYVVQAYDQDTLVMVRSEPVAAGTRELVLRVPADAILERIAGVVVARDGTPLAGVRVETRLVIAQAGGAMSFENGAGVTTDTAGRFTLERVPARYLSLQVGGDTVIPDVFELDDARAAGEQRLEVARRCHFRVELGSAPAVAEGEAPDGISALDFDGNPLSLHLFQGNGWSASSRVRLAELGTNTLAVSEDVRTLVYYRGNTELRRVPLALAPGDVVVVHADG